MLRQNEIINIVERNEGFHIINPKNRVHFITDKIGAYIIQNLSSGQDLHSVYSNAKELFGVEVNIFNNYLKEFYNNRLFENSMPGPSYHFDYLKSYSSMPDGYCFHPNAFYWVITWNCNLRCKMCPLWAPEAEGKSLAHINKEPVLTLEEAKKIITDLAESGISVIHITGGEPVLYKHLVEAVKFIKQNKMHVSVFSNGTLIDEKYALNLINTGIDKIGISLDGLQKVHDEIRGKGNFAKAVDGIKHLIKARNDTGAETRLYIMSTITRYNYDQLSGLLKFGAEIGMDGMFTAHPSFSFPASLKKQKQILASCFLPELEGPSWNVGQSLIGAQFNTIPINKIQQTLQELAKLAEEYKVEFSPSLNLSENEMHSYYQSSDDKVINKCLWPWKGGFMDSGGQLYPCVKVKVGDLKHEKFLDLWNSEIYRRFRRLIKKDGIIPCCERCCQLVNEQARIDLQSLNNL